MKIEFTCNLDDFLEANFAKDPDRKAVKARFKNAARTKFPVMATIVLVMFPLSAFLVILSSSVLAWIESPRWLIADVPALLLVGIIVRALMPSSRRRIFRRQFENNPKWSLPITYQVDDSAFRYHSTTWDCTIEWPSIRSVYTSKNLIVVYDVYTRFFVAKRAFATAEQAAECRKFIADKIHTSAAPNG